MMIGKISNRLVFMVLQDMHSMCNCSIEFCDHIAYYTYNTVSRIDMSQASELELANLSSACKPATFSVDQKDVHMGKLGKLENSTLQTLLPPSICTSLGL